MKLILLFLITAVIPLTTGTMFLQIRKKPQPTQKCYSSKAICVPIEFCPRIYKTLNRHLNSHHRAKRPHEVTCRQCKTKDDGQQLSVLCEPGDLTKGKDCVTSRNVAGQCIAEEYCSLPVAKSHHNKWQQQQQHQLKGKTCFEEDAKNYYCCPRQFHSKKPIPDGSIENVYPKCRDSRRLLGRCVPVRQCDHLNRIKTNRTRENFIHKNLCPSDDLTGRGRSICCATASSTAKHSSDHVDWIKHPKAARLGLEKCGSVSMVDNIYRGTKAVLGQYPWMVNLLYWIKYRYQVKAAGTLIHPRYVLTAAHAANKDLKKVRLGDYDLSKTLDCDDERCAEPAKEYSIKKKIVHERFKRSSDYDIALLELYRDVELFPEQIYPICLPLTETLLMLQPRHVTITGWGWSDRRTSVLLEADLEVVNRSKRICPGESTFCARGRNWSGHCRGDSGGPYQAILTIGPYVRYVQFGVISAGSGECTGTKYGPGVGVGVAYYISWILDHMNI